MIKTIPIGPYALYVDDVTGPGPSILGNGLNYEVHIRAELEKWIPKSVGFLDIGANVGLHSISAKTIRPDVPVFAIDINPNNTSLLLRTIAENHISGLTVIQAALADSPRAILANDDPSNTSCTMIGKEPEHEQDYPRLTPALPLDFFNLPPIDLVKIDIEGFEFAAFQGASRLLASRPRIIFEFCPQFVHRCGATPSGQLDWLMSRGYKLTVLDYLPGMRKTCESAQMILDHLTATSGWITDIIAEPV